MKIELLIPTGQYANIKFFVERETEEGLELEINRLWLKYVNYFDKQAERKRKMIEDIRYNNPVSQAEYDLYASSDLLGNFVYQANEAKKEYKRSPEAKAKIEYRGGTKIKKSEFNLKDFLDKKAKQDDTFINELPEQ